jgi:hypothetical protein
MVSKLKNDEFFPDIESFDSKMKCYSAYEQLHGDMGNSKAFQFEYGNYIVVGHGQKTNYNCGVFRRYDGCNRVELHNQTLLNGQSHVGEIYVHMVHHWCCNYSCPVCYLKGACMREAEHASQRILWASKGGKDKKGVYHAPLGDPQHIIISAPKSDYELANLKHVEWTKKVRNILAQLGVISGCHVFHGFRYANYAESLEKGVPFGYYWSPHFHIVGFIQGGYGKCRHCSKTARVMYTAGGKTVTKYGDKRFCMDCEGFERRVRESNEKNGYIIVNTDERESVFGTVWYQLSHMAILKDGKI